MTKKDKIDIISGIIVVTLAISFCKVATFGFKKY